MTDDVGGRRSLLGTLLRILLVIALLVAFLTAATSVAASLNCDVVAEGVETQAEAEVVQLLGIAYVQGFRYRKPGPIEEFRPEIVG